MTIDRRALRNELVKQFNEEELKTLAFDLGMDSIAGNDRNSLARELIAACERTERCDELQAEIAKARPTPQKPPTPAQQAATPRRRGGQPKNTNAVKHGLYARHFRTDELSALAVTTENGLAEEIAMMRVVMGRVFDLANDAEDLDTVSDLLGSLGVAATRLSGLLKTQRLLSGDHNAAAAAITEAIAAVVKEFCLA